MNTEQIIKNIMKIPEHKILYTLITLEIIKELKDFKDMEMLHILIESVALAHSIRIEKIKTNCSYIPDPDEYLYREF